MGHFYVDTKIVGDPRVIDLGHDKFRLLIEAACRYNRSRNPEDAPPAHLMDLFKFPRRKKHRRRDVSIDRHGLWQSFSGVCYLCGTFVDYAEFHVEHVIPLARGGRDSIENVNIAHPECNRRKGTRLLSELDWYKP